MKILPPPGPARRRQVTGLAAALLVLSGAVWYRTRPAPSTTAGAPKTAQPSVARAGTRAVPDPVRLEALDRVDQEAEPGRNPFSYGAPPAPPPAPLPPPAATPVYTPPPPPVPQGPPPIALQLNGLLVDPRSGRTMAMLRDPASGTLFQAFEGDVVDGRYRIVKVGLQSVVVSYVDGSSARTLALGG